MFDSLSTKAIIAKSRSIYGTFLKPEDYDQLIRKTSVTEICTYLKNNTRYAKILMSSNEDAIHRGQLESLLKRDNFNKYMKLWNFLNEEYDSFYAYQMKNIEIEQLLEAIMAINAKQDNSFIQTFPGFLLKYLNIDLMRIAKANTFDDFLEAIKDTPYYKIMKPFSVRRANDDSVDYSACEVALYSYYYEYLLERIKKNFSGDCRKELEKAVLISIDLKNITAAYRMKIFFDMNNPDIKSKLLPFHYKTTEKKMDVFLDEKDTDILNDKIKNIYYFKNFNEFKNNHIEHPASKFLYNYFRKKVRISTEAPVVFYSLIQLMDIELENVINIIEGVRYKLSSSEIEKLLIM